MTTLGCSEGRDATAWTTYITNPNIRVDMPNGSIYEGIECDQLPLAGRDGGGLFTIQGELAGVCDFHDNSRPQHGIYAHPKAIHRLLARNQIAPDNAAAPIDKPAHPDPAIKAPDEPIPLRPTSPPKTARDPEQRLSDLERKVERILDLLEAQGRKPRR